MEQRRVGASYLRKLTAESLAALEEVLIITVEGQDVAAIVPWGYYQNSFVGESERISSVSSGEPDKVLEEVKARLERILAGVEHLLELESMMEAVVRHVVEAPSRGSAVERSFEEGGVYAPYPTATGAAIHAEQAAARPSLPQPNATCRHCGQSWFSPSRHATICSECKASGHTNAPAECPKCTAGEQI